MADSYLTRTPGSAGSRVKWTYSVWLKRSSLGHNPIWAATTDGSNYDEFYFNSTNKIQFSTVTSGTQKAIRTTRQFRDTSAWYHIVLVYDTGNSTDTDHAQLWINGVRETSFEDTTLLASGANNVQSNWNNNIEMKIGRVTTNTGAYFNGYMSHAAFVNDAVVAPTSFGETDSTSGIWKFKSPSGVTFGTNGFHLKFENSGALGTDSSGQGNNFTVNGTLKQSLDTPSNVYPTLNPSFNLSDIQLTEAGMRTKNTNSNWKYINSTLAAPSGKWYCEHKININGGYVMVGVTDMQYATSQDKNSYTHCGAGTGGVGFYNADGNKYLQASASTFASSYTTGDIIGCALDMDNNKVYFSKNGVWANGSGGYGSSTFDAAVGAITLPTTNATYGFAVSVRSSAVVQSNFGTGQFGATTITSAGSNGNGSLFEYDVPSGYYALNTKNINTYG